MSADAMSGARGRLVLVRPDGSEGERIPLHAELTVIGRDSRGPFAGDMYLSPKHAAFTFQGNTLRVRDQESANGVYLCIARQTPTEISSGTVFRIGQEVIRFEAIESAAKGDVEVMGSPNPGYLGRICLVIGKTATGNCFCIPPEGMHLGRERGDILFPEDGYVSGLHCRIHGEGGRIYLTDLGSSNGTFLRIQSETAVPSGGLLLLGQQLFRAEY